MLETRESAREREKPFSAWSGDKIFAVKRRQNNFSNYGYSTEWKHLQGAAGYPGLWILLIPVIHRGSMATGKCSKIEINFYCSCFVVVVDILGSVIASDSHYWGALGFWFQDREVSGERHPVCSESNEIPSLLNCASKLHWPAGGNSPESVSRDALGNQKKLLARDDNNTKKWVEFNKNTTQRGKQANCGMAEKSCKEKIRTLNRQKRRSRGWYMSLKIFDEKIFSARCWDGDDDFMKRDHLLITSSGITSVWSGL